MGGSGVDKGAQEASEAVFGGVVLGHVGEAEVAGEGALKDEDGLASGI